MKVATYEEIETRFFEGVVLIQVYAGYLVKRVHIKQFAAAYQPAYGEPGADIALVRVPIIDHKGYFRVVYIDAIVGNDDLGIAW